MAADARSSHTSGMPLGTGSQVTGVLGRVTDSTPGRQAGIETKARCAAPADEPGHEPVRAGQHVQPNRRIPIERKRHFVEHHPDRLPPTSPRSQPETERQVGGLPAKSVRHVLHKQPSRGSNDRQLARQDAQRSRTKPIGQPPTVTLAPSRPACPACPAWPACRACPPQLSRGAHTVTSSPAAARPCATIRV